MGGACVRIRVLVVVGLLGHGRSGTHRFAPHSTRGEAFPQMHVSTGVGALGAMAALLQHSPRREVLRRPDGRRGRGHRPHPRRPARGGPRRPRRPRRGVHPTRDRRPALPRGGGSGGPPRQPQPHRVVAGNGVADPGEGARQHGDRAQRPARAVGLDARPAIHSSTWEWDHASPAEQWKRAHNDRHHILHQRPGQGQRPRLRDPARRRGPGVEAALPGPAAVELRQRVHLRVRHRDVRPRPRRPPPRQRRLLPEQKAEMRTTAREGRAPAR